MPLQAPINYLVDIPDPTEAIRKNLETATGLIGAQQRGQALDAEAQLNQAKATAEQQKASQAQALQANLALVAANPTPDAIARLSILHPEIGEKLKAGYDMLDANDQKAQLSLAQKLHAAMLNGAPDVAQRLALDSATANENSGNAPRAAQLRSLAGQIQQNPKIANLSIGSLLSTVQGADKYLANFGKFSTLEADRLKAESDAAAAGSDATKKAADAKYADRIQAAGADKAEADAGLAGTTANVAKRTALQKAEGEIAQQEATRANTYSEITKRGVDAALSEREFALKKTKEDREAADLPPEVRKEVNAHAAAADEAESAATKAGNLAAMFEKVGSGVGSSGASARVIEGLKRIWGSENGYSAMLKQFEQLRNEATLAQLKGLGRITEKEIEMVQRGLPEATASPAVVAPYLRLMEKASKAEVESQRAQSDWKTATLGNMTAPAVKAFTAAGRQVLPGDTFDMVKRLTPTQSVRRAQLMREAAKP